MVVHKQKLLGHVPGCAEAWLRHCMPNVMHIEFFYWERTAVLDFVNVIKISNSHIAGVYMCC